MKDENLKRKTMKSGMRNWHLAGKLRLTGRRTGASLGVFTRLLTPRLCNNVRFLRMHPPSPLKRLKLLHNFGDDRNRTTPVLERG